MRFAPRFHLPVRLTRLILCLLLACSVAHAQEGPPPGGMEGEGGMGGMGGGRGIRGTVTTLTPPQNPARITIRTEENTTWQVTVGNNTHVMKDRQPAKLADIHVGDMLIAGGERDDGGKVVHAVFTAVISADEVRKMMEGMGVKWVRGRITAIHEASITVQRPDGKSQTLVADENTSFRKDRQSVTLADIHPGDSVFAQGSLKDNVFVPETLAVFDPAAARGEGFGRGSGSGSGEGRRRRVHPDGPESPASPSPPPAAPQR